MATASPSPVPPSASPAQAGPAQPRPRANRRRQRSVRVTVAVTLLTVATAAVLAAVPTQSATWLTAAAVLSVACGWASARIIYTELAQSRRDNAADRAAQAQAYRSMFAARAEEHATFTTTMTDRVSRREREVRELTGTLVLAEQRAAEAESRARREGRRADEAEAHVRTLEQALAERLAADAAQEGGQEHGRTDDAHAGEPVPDAAQAMLPGVDDELDTVVDLLAWEERLTALTGERHAQKHA